MALAVVTSLMAGGVGRLQGWPLWAIVLAMVVPAMPVFASPAAQLGRHDGALAFFYLLALAQAGHVLEHLAQVTQLHVLHHTGEEAHGVFGALDVEWVHFIWNSAILLAVVFLLRHYRRNVWLWSALILAGWHQVEHTYIMSVYLQTGQMGTPGLLAAGGAVGGGLPLRRPDLHFLYNVLETTPLVLAFLHQVGQLAGARRPAVMTKSPDSDQLSALPQARGASTYPPVLRRPVAAFADVAGALRAGGGLGMLVWRELGRNDWVTAVRAPLAMGASCRSHRPARPSSSPNGVEGNALPGEWLKWAGRRRIPRS